jgi:hypothetical protein
MLLATNLQKKAIKNNIEKSDKIKLQNINTDIKIKKHPHSIYMRVDYIHYYYYQDYQKQKNFKYG